ncbi:AMP-binding protein [Halotalea alkalilenta]|uniref:AMP-binding protein n=1 Tax=Halotalea alkalilenta TaxID=376489 RepID=UPI0009ECE749|nr:AMP-binding protein [Halotalea alkalilenta]
MFVRLSDLPWRRVAPSPAELAIEHWVGTAELLRRSAAWRAWLDGRPGGRWLLHQPDPLEFTAALLALWESGRIAVLPGDSTEATRGRLHGALDGVLPRTPPAEVTAAVPVKAISPSSIAVEIHTSGSTGEPEWMPKRFDQLDAELEALAAWLGDERWAVISQVSHQHLFGLTLGILLPLCLGAPFSGGTSRYPEILAMRLGQLTDTALAALVVSSPSQLSRLPSWSDWPRGGRRCLISAGAPLSAETARSAAQLLDAEMLDLYGSSETGVIASRRPLENPLWRPFEGVECRLESSRLLLRSPFLADPTEWWEQPDEIRSQPDGFHLLKRRDRILKVAGKRVSLDTLDISLRRDQRVLDARCVPIGNTDGRLGAIVVLGEEHLPHRRGERRALTSQLRQRLLGQGIEAVAIPRYWRFVERLPLNLQGKLDQGAIARLFADLDDHYRPRWLGCDALAAGRCTITLEVPERLAQLRGHFEDCPIVPGVALVDWAASLGEECFGPLGRFTALEQLKFQRPLRPGMRFRLELSQRADGVQFHIDSRLGRHCSGRLAFTSPEEQRNG